MWWWRSRAQNWTTNSQLNPTHCWEKYWEPLFATNPFHSDNSWNESPPPWVLFVILFGSVNLQPESCRLLQPQFSRTKSWTAQPCWRGGTSLRDDLSDWTTQVRMTVGGHVTQAWQSCHHAWHESSSEETTWNQATNSNSNNVRPSSQKTRQCWSNIRQDSVLNLNLNHSG